MKPMEPKPKIKYYVDEEGFEGMKVTCRAELDCSNIVLIGIRAVFANYAAKPKDPSN